MKNLRFVKHMFKISVICTAIFVIMYCYGINFCANFYELLDCTLPFCFLAIISVIVFGAATAKGYIEEKAAVRLKRNYYVKKKKINYDRRYIIKTYGRNGYVQTKHINMRGNYGLLKSA